MDMCQQICIFDMIATRKKNTPTHYLGLFPVVAIQNNFNWHSWQLPVFEYISRYVKIHVAQIFFLFSHNNVWEAAASPAETELLLPAGLWINFLMLPFQNIHSVPGGGWAVRVRAGTECRGGQQGVMDEENLALEVSTWWAGRGPARSRPGAQSVPCVR